jgi:hypothetical protein
MMLLAIGAAQNDSHFSHSRQLTGELIVIMSFDWNASSDEEENDTWKDYAALSTERLVVKDTQISKATTDWLDNNDDGDDEEDNEEALVDWEDADEDTARGEETYHESKENSTTLKAVTIELGSTTNESPRKKGQVRRNKWRLEQLPHHLQRLLQDVSQCHLLMLTSRAAYASRISCDPELLSLCLSVVPRTHHEKSTSTKHAHGSDDTRWYAPTLPDIEFLLEWFYNWKPANQSTQRRYAHRRKKMKRTRVAKKGTQDEASNTLQYNDGMANLSSVDRLKTCLRKNRNDAWTSNETCQIFLAFARALRFRVRYVQAMDSIPLDLQLDHPVLQYSGNIFRHVNESIRGKTPRTPEIVDESFIATKSSSFPPEPVLGWIEILCHSKGKLHWIHVDPVRKLLNEPQKVESLWGTVLKVEDKSVGLNKKCSAVSLSKACPLSYALAVEHAACAMDSHGKVPLRFTDVTPRYAQSWVSTLRRRGVMRGKYGVTNEQLQLTWWNKTLHALNQSSNAQKEQHPSVTNLKNLGVTIDDAISVNDSEDDRKPAAVPTGSEKHDQLFHEVEHHEEQELKATIQDEAIPTSKTAFKTHPVYVIPSVLNQTEVIAPDVKFCGVCKGEFVYRRSDVSIVRPARKWLYHGRKVRDSELDKPIRCVKARPKAVSKSFKALKSYGIGASNDGSQETREMIIAKASEPLEDDMERLYAIWQTDPWSPMYVGPNDPIPVNEYKNVELELINPGLVYIDERGAANTAKMLGIPYAPCFLGFEGHHGNRTPTIRGIVVHEHNAPLIYDAHRAVVSHQETQEDEKQRQAALRLWKRLMMGLLNKARIDREYGQTKDES